MPSENRSPPTEFNMELKVDEARYTLRKLVTTLGIERGMQGNFIEEWLSSKAVQRTEKLRMMRATTRWIMERNRKIK